MLRNTVNCPQKCTARVNCADHSRTIDLPGNPIREGGDVVVLEGVQQRGQVAEHDKRMPVRGALDVTRATTEIGFKPKVDLEEGLKRYHDYLIEQRSRGIV